MKKKLLYCTYNQAKFNEIQKALDLEKFTLLSPDDLNLHIDVEETGSDYKENARLKVAAHLDKLEDRDIIAFSDDTGVEIEALNGEPGVHTRRWNGTRMTDEEIIEYALKRLSGVPETARRAKFVTCIAFGSKNSVIRFSTGELVGKILIEEDSTTDRMEGFPFGTIFWIDELKTTLGKFHASRNDEKFKGFKTHREKALDKFVQEIS